jgi:hypothetical protein
MDGTDKCFIVPYIIIRSTQQRTMVVYGYIMGLLYVLGSYNIAYRQRISTM